MNLQQVRYFVALCETRSFVLAARRCNVTQPSLTHSIKTLEEELGGRLFNRRPTHPTELGEALRSHLESIVRALDETYRIAAALRDDSAPGPNVSRRPCAPPSDGRRGAPARRRVD
jgi:DNA-binding transcriptional LysR family regulator